MMGEQIPAKPWGVDSFFAINNLFADILRDLQVTGSPGVALM